jgi:hypothetical protein
MIKRNKFSYDTSKYGSLTEAVKAEREARAIKSDYQRNVKIISDAVRPSPPAAPAIDPVALGEAIVAAGLKRRGLRTPEFDNAPRFDNTPAGRLAAKICRAAAKARGQAVDEDDESESYPDDVDDERDTGDDDDEVARAKKLADEILRAGRRRRNEE